MPSASGTPSEFDALEREAVDHVFVLQPGYAVGLGLHAYDGYVLQTALAEGLALLTLDIGLARAAQKIGVKLKEF